MRYTCLLSLVGTVLALNACERHNVSELALIEAPKEEMAVAAPGHSKKAAPATIGAESPAPASKFFPDSRQP